MLKNMTPSHFRVHSIINCFFSPGLQLIIHSHREKENSVELKEIYENTDLTTLKITSL